MQGADAIAPTWGKAVACINVPVGRARLLGSAAERRCKRGHTEGDRDRLTGRGPLYLHTVRNSAAPRVFSMSGEQRSLD